MRLRLNAALALFILPVWASQAQTQLAPYQPNVQVTGVIKVWGSPQMGDLLHQYEAGFHKVQPNVTFEENLKSTITAVAGVYTRRADIGLLGRELWPTEGQAFESVTGHAPTVIDVATASYNVPKATFALMVYVPRANPITAISTSQLERIFGSGKAAERIHTWGDLGLTGEWATRPIHIYGFAIENDKSQIFAQLVFQKNERFNSELRESTNVPNGADAGESIVRAVASDPDGIGISNAFYATSAVKALALSTPSHPDPIVPSRETVATRLYPLTRAIYMVLDVDAAAPPSPATLEFLRFVLSHEGSDAVTREGNYLPLPPAVAAEQTQKLQRK